MKLDLKKDVNKGKVCRERKQHMPRLWSGSPEHEQMKSEKEEDSPGRSVYKP